MIQFSAWYSCWLVSTAEPDLIAKVPLGVKFTPFSNRCFMVSCAAWTHLDVFVGDSCMHWKMVLTAGNQCLVKGTLLLLYLLGVFLKSMAHNFPCQGGGGELLTPSTFSTATVYMWRLRHNLSLKSGPWWTHDFFWCTKTLPLVESVLNLSGGTVESLKITAWTLSFGNLYVWKRLRGSGDGQSWIHGSRVWLLWYMDVIWGAHNGSSYL